MYDLEPLRPATDALWAFLAGHLRAAGIVEVPDTLDRRWSHTDSWTHPRLLLGQACEYPLATRYRGSVRLVATPSYRAPGCTPGHYCSVVVVRRDDAATSLESLRGRTCAVNEPDSNSGMNLLRAALAPVAAGRCLFSAVITTGTHANSVEAVAGGLADVAAIDCVTFAHLSRWQPPLVARLKVLARTPTSPSLPFVTSRHTPEPTLAALRAALKAAILAPELAEVRERLLLSDVLVSPDEELTAVRALERDAATLGYPRLC